MERTRTTTRARGCDGTKIYQTQTRENEPTGRQRTPTTHLARRRRSDANGQRQTYGTARLTRHLSRTHMECSPRHEPIHCAALYCHSLCSAQTKPTRSAKDNDLHKRWATMTVSIFVSLLVRRSVWERPFEVTGGKTNKTTSCDTSWAWSTPAYQQNDFASLVSTTATEKKLVYVCGEVKRTPSG